MIFFTFLPTKAANFTIGQPKTVKIDTIEYFSINAIGSKSVINIFPTLKRYKANPAKSPITQKNLNLPLLY